MSEQPSPREVENTLGERRVWGDGLSWLLLLRSVRIALDPRLLVMAALGLAVMLAGWWVVGRLYAGSQDPSVRQLVELFGHGTWALRDPDPTTGSVAATISDGAAISSTFYAPGGRWLPLSPVTGTWAALSRPFRAMFDPTLTVVGFTFLLLCGLWAVVVWALFGAIISRIAGVKFARDERTTLGRAAQHARKRYGAYFWAPVFPLIGVLLLAIPIFAVGWLFRFDVGVLLLALVWPLALLGGLLMAIFLVGLFFGWPLMWATISVEGTDSFDALSRTYAYVYQRPLHFLGYAVVAGVLGWLAAIVVRLFAVIVVVLTFWAASWTSGSARIDAIVDRLPTVSGFEWLHATILPFTVTAEREAFSAAGRGGLAVLAFWMGCVQFLTLGFGVSYFWTAASGIYLLLRQRVDNTELDEIHLEDEQTSYGLPPLDEDEAGVPRVAENEVMEPAATDQPHSDAEDRAGTSESL